MDKNKDPDEAELRQWFRREIRPMLARIDPAYYGELLEKIEVALKKIGSEPTSDPDSEAAIELYAVKSFQAQDISGVFNQGRMDASVRAAKPKKGVNRGSEYGPQKKSPQNEPGGPF